MCICTMLYLMYFTYPNKMFVAFDQLGSDNRGFTVSTVLNLNQTANCPKSALFAGAMFLRVNYRWNAS